MGSTVILQSYENIFCAQNKQKNDSIQQFVYSASLYSAILESIHWM